VLDLARDVAHGVLRPAAPLSTYLLGLAVGRGADPKAVAETIGALTVQIRNLPDEVYLTYKARAMRARQSLQEYLLAKLIEDAREPTLDEILDLARRNAVESVTTADLLDAIDQERPQR
jgi:hypothetical protein